ncbi:MAG TPA: hypothetical protein VM012_15205 [Flavitalea sp.]|nr:hypothetical protein [Flavitalea sp.]
MRKYITSILFIVAINNSFGQSIFKKNDIYIEAGGNGLFGSVNYERQLTHEPGIGMRVGLGFYAENLSYITIPVGIDYLFELKRKSSFIDAGLGITWTRSEITAIGRNVYAKGDRFVNFIPGIGYRRHTPRDVMWRVSITPVINKNTFVPWLGISVGKRF